MKIIINKFIYILHRRILRGSWQDGSHGHPWDGRWFNSVHYENEILHPVCIQPAEGQPAEVCALLIWDEAPMMQKHVYEALNRTLIDITGNYSPFGGIMTVLGGDFRQVLPVVPKGSKSDIIAVTLNQSRILWPHVKVLRLTTNMRVQRLLQHGDPEEARRLQDFADYLKRVGDGAESVNFQVGGDSILFSSC